MPYVRSPLIHVRLIPICCLYFRLLYQEEKDRTAQYQGLLRDQLRDQLHDQLRDQLHNQLPVQLHNLKPTDPHHALHRDLKLSDTDLHQHPGQHHGTDPDQHPQGLCLPNNQDTHLDHLQHVHITTIHIDQEVLISHHLDTYQITDQSRLRRQPADQYLKGLFGIMMPQKVCGINFVDEMC